MARLERGFGPGTIFFGLMILSLTALALPASWTDPLRHAAQLLVPPQDLLYATSYRAAQAMAARETDAESDARERESLRLELLSMAAALEQKCQDYDRLSAVRKDHQLSGHPILPAKVIARDAAALRDSVLVARGAQRGVTRGDWMAARFIVDKGQIEGVGEGQAVLSRHSLVGLVEQVSPYMARVQLLSDVDSPRVEVRIGRVEKNRPYFVDHACSLRGAGSQRMLIDGVDYRVIEREGESPSSKPRIRVGDAVFTAPGQLGLPSPLLIGRVTEITEDPQRRLVYNLTVEPVVRLETLRDVYIIPLTPTLPPHLRD